MKSYGAGDRIGKIVDYVGSQDSLPESIKISYKEFNGVVWKSQIEFKINYENGSYNTEGIVLSTKLKGEFKRKKFLNNELSLLMEGLSEKMKHSESFNPSVCKDFKKGEMEIFFCPEKVESGHEKTRKSFGIDYGERETGEWRERWVPHNPEMRVVINDQNKLETNDRKRQII